MFLVLTFRTCFRFIDFQNLHIHKKLRRPLLYQLFTEALQISALVEPNQMELGFVITNDKASYVDKEDSICLFSIAREAALNEQQIKPCVPYRTVSPRDNCLSKCTSDSFPHTKYMSSSVENSHNHTLMFCCPPIPGRRFEKQGKLWDRSVPQLFSIS